MRLRPELTVDEAISYLRKQKPDLSLDLSTTDMYWTLNSVYWASYPHSTLFSSPADQTVRDVMTNRPRLCDRRYGSRTCRSALSGAWTLCVPVVDNAGRMKGVVTVDDIVAVLDEEATEDMQKTGGVAALDAPYLEATFGSMLRKRGGWLTLLFLGEMLTATAMAWFEEQLARAIVLALFVPLIISSGGNAGSQATTLVIRAMALGEVTSRDWLGVVRREFSVGLALGVLLAFNWSDPDSYCGRDCSDRMASIMCSSR